MLTTKKSNLFSKLITICLLSLSFSLFLVASTTHAATINGQDIVNYAKKFLGTPYVWDGTTPSGFDCSGFTQYVYKNFGISLPRTVSYDSSSQRGVGTRISQIKDLQIGDLVVTNNYGHIGIYVGNGQYIHASSPGDVVKISSIYAFNEGRRLPNVTNSTYNYSSIAGLTFDAKFYADKYPDLKKAFGYNSTELYNHFLNYGIKEGRCASPLFDVKFYLTSHADLVKAFGSDYTKAYNHFLTYGYKESRNLSPVFDVKYYLANNRDVVNAFGNDYYKLLNHFREYGMKEGRQGSANFSMKNYKARYTDLQKAFGSNNAEYYKHYLIYGINENRNGK